MLPSTRHALFRAIGQTRSQSRHFSQSTPARSLFSDYVSKLKTSVREITPKELNDKVLPKGPSPSLHIFDVRETDEFNKNQLPYAIYLGRGNLERDVEGIVPDNYDVIVLYCSGGNRSVVAADALQRMGYQNVYSLQGGLGRWQSEGYKVLENKPVYSERIEYRARPGPEWDGPYGKTWDGHERLPAGGAHH
ncbi:hypothetical protein HK097_002429 [Rhizophlyctis rosea]|uniref:Rhodanese domain-containing protein n=1 Tax=Rhizophlyctis rosea TaxID=64517 RepID=A0AAD5SGL6_9FUNG|nr:hypothetical protein HK097_002429 [Rhizophlyctis rosea]